MVTAAHRPQLILASNKSDLGAAAFDDAFILKQLDKELCAVLLLSGTFGIAPSFCWHPLKHLVVP